MNVAALPNSQARYTGREPMTAADPQIILDLSRLLSRLLHKTPTGVDRVEMAYARELLNAVPERIAFGAVHPAGLYGRLPNTAVATFLERTDALWQGEGGSIRGRTQVWMDALAACMVLRPRAVPRPDGRPRVLLQASPHHLHRELQTAAIIQREQAKFVCLLHDLIPIEYPEYARPNGTKLHLQRIGTVARLADAVVANSTATKRAFLPYLHAEGRDIPVQVAHLGIERRPFPIAPSTAAGKRPYFVCLGTIEPRKNHLLLLNIWRRLLSEGKGNAPRLVLIGRRGWENENIIDMLDRCPILREGVEEHNGLPDGEVHRTLTGARALLMPSFAEGYGLPVAEALDLGVPVICSGLPALREVGGDIPDYLDPLDGLGWETAIREYAKDVSSRRDAQLSRLGNWETKGWDEHIRRVIDITTSCFHGDC